MDQGEAPLLIDHLKTKADSAVPCPLAIVRSMSASCQSPVHRSGKCNTTTRQQQQQQQHRREQHEEQVAVAT